MDWIKSENRREYNRRRLLKAMDFAMLTMVAIAVSCMIILAIDTSRSIGKSHDQKAMERKASEMLSRCHSCHNN